MKKTSKSSPTTIDEYLLGLPDTSRMALEKLRKTIRSVAPNAEELISYQVPSFKHRYMLVGFAGFKDHCSFFVMSTGLMKTLQKELEPYDTATATIHFTADKPLPVG